MRLLIVFLLWSSVVMGQNYNFDRFSVGWGEKGAEWCTYMLTEEMVKASVLKLKRPRFKNWRGVKDRHYVGSGWDRGHLAPAKTFSFSKSIFLQTFILANVIPQSPFVNQRVWKYLEEYERELAKVERCVIVTIEVHYPEKGAKVGKVWIPSGYTRIIRSCDLKEEYGRFYFRNIKERK